MSVAQELEEISNKLGARYSVSHTWCAEREAEIFRVILETDESDFYCESTWKPSDNDLQVMVINLQGMKLHDKYGELYGQLHITAAHCLAKQQTLDEKFRPLLADMLEDARELERIFANPVSPFLTNYFALFGDASKLN